MGRVLDFKGIPIASRPEFFRKSKLWKKIKIPLYLVHKGSKKCGAQNTPISYVLPLNAILEHFFSINGQNCR